MSEDKKITIRLPARIPLRDVPGIVQEIFGGDPVSRQAVYQWAKHGRIGANGENVKLQTYLRNGQLHTKREWIKAFVEAL